MLTDTEIRALKPCEKVFKTFDGGGLFLQTTPKGGRLWRLKYRFGGREKLLALGIYPDTSLKLARTKRENAKVLLARDIDPGVQRREKKAERVFRLAIATGRAERNIAADLRGTLTAVTITHFAATTDPDAVGQLLRAIDGYQGLPSVMHALTLAPYIFLRPGELRGARWSEFELKIHNLDNP